MKIKLAEKKDINKILILLNSDLNLRGNNSHPYEKYHVLNFIVGPIYKTFVCKEDNKILGVAVVEFWNKSKEAYLSQIIVDKKYRRKGIASALINYMEQIAEKKKMNELTLFTKTSNKKMQHLLKNLKWKRGNKFYFYSKEL